MKQKFKLNITNEKKDYGVVVIGDYQIKNLTSTFSKFLKIPPKLLQINSMNHKGVKRFYINFPKAKVEVHQNFWNTVEKVNNCLAEGKVEEVLELFKEWQKE